MSSTYAQATVCKYGEKPESNCTKFTLDPEISERLAHSRDPEELKYYWEAWHENSGKKMRNDYGTYVDLLNKMARANGYSDAAQMWQSRFEDRNFGEKIDKLWSQVEPLYADLHEYTKYKLLEIYGMSCDIYRHTWVD